MKSNMTAASASFDAPTADEVRKKLDEKIPRSAVSLRDGGGPKKLSYLEGWYVIARLNEVLGQGKWQYETYSLEMVHSGEVNGKQCVHYIAKVQLTAEIGSETVRFSDYGYGDGTDKYNIGKAHELAAKEAVTDGVKRCAKNLGMSLGLALYDKTQENVSDEDETKEVPSSGSKNTKAAAMGAIRGNSTETASPAPAQEVIGEAPKDRPVLLKMIGEMANVLIKQRKVTLTGLKEHLDKTYQASKKEELNDTQATEFYAYLKGQFNAK